MNDPLAVIKRLATNGLGVPLIMMLMLSMMVVPLPPWLLDVLFTNFLMRHAQLAGVIPQLKRNVD